MIFGADRQGWRPGDEQTFSRSCWSADDTSVWKRGLRALGRRPNEPLSPRAGRTASVPTLVPGGFRRTSGRMHRQPRGEGELTGNCCRTRRQRTRRAPHRRRAAAHARHIGPAAPPPARPARDRCRAGRRCPGRLQVGAEHLLVVAQAERPFCGTSRAGIDSDAQLAVGLLEDRAQVEHRVDVVARRRVSAHRRSRRARQESAERAERVFGAHGRRVGERDTAASGRRPCSDWPSASASRRRGGRRARSGSACRSRSPWRDAGASRRR